MSNSTTTQPPPDPNDNRGPVVLTITIALLILSTTFVLLRLVSRIGVVKKVSWDDYFIVLAWILAFGFSFSICWGVHSGLGRHELYIPDQNQVTLRKSEYAFSVLYNPVLMATKTSILIFYLTLSKTHQAFRWATRATLFVVNVAGLALTILNIVQCHPVWAVFVDVVPAYATCTDLVTLYLSSAPVNIITDLAILFLPMPILTGMRLPRKQKIILIVTFSFGAFVMAVDVIRIAYLQQAFQVRLSEVGQENATTSRALEQDDFSWYASLSFMWSTIEVHVGIICACVPSLKPLVSKVLPSMLRDLNDPNDISQTDMNGSTHPGGTMNSGFRWPSISNNPATPDGLAKLPTNTDGNGGGNPEDDTDMLDFLTTPGMVRQHVRSPTLATAATVGTAFTSPRSRAGSLTFFDFYNLKEKKPMTKFTNKESLFPVALVTILFFMWGFAYGLLDVLNSQFEEVVQLTAGQAVGLHAAYFAAYFVGPLTCGRIVFKKWGFKATFITGLCIYGVGTLIFWPSAVLTSFTAFIISNFIVGLGVSILEVAANPFIALCGPPEYAEIRLNISQGVQAIGSVVSPLLAKKVLFKNVVTGTSLIDVQWTYLGIALFAVGLAACFHYFPIPEATDDDFEAVAEKRQTVNERKVFEIPFVYITLALGVFSMFCYVGGQEAASVYFQNYIFAVNPTARIDPFDYQTIGRTVFAVGRFICAALGFILKPRWILLILFIGMIVTSILCMVCSGSAGSAMITLFELFQSGVFPIIFALCLRGLGSRTKSGAIYLTAAISGGAVLPVIFNPVANSHGVPYAFCVVVASSAFGLLLPLYLMIWRPVKMQVDPVHMRKTNLPNDKGKARVKTQGQRPASPYKMASQALAGKMGWTKGHSAEGPSAEHVEGDGIEEKHKETEEISI